MASQQKETSELSLPGLVRQLADETTTLVRQELELARAEAARAGEAVVTLAKQELQLAKAEMQEKGRKAAPGIGMIGAAVGLGLLGARLRPRGRRPLPDRETASCRGWAISA